MKRAMVGVLDRWLHTAEPGSWRYRIVWLYIYAIVVYYRTKWELVRYLPPRLQARCFFRKRTKVA
jgi:hypothetical protein